MASVYILFSQKLNRFYIGSCNNLSYRIQLHSNKKFTKSFTAKAHDWELFYSIDNLGYNQSRQIEIHIKKMKSTQYIQNLKKHLEITQKLIEKYK